MGASAFVPDDDPTDVQQLAVNAVIERLADTGMSTEIIAYATDTPLHNVRAIVKRTTHTADKLDEKITKEVGRLAQLALKEAFLILEFGPSEQKMSIIKSVLGGLTKQATAGETSGTEEIRVAFDQLLADVKDVPKLTTVVSETDFISAELASATKDADDQDERP